MKAAGTVIMRGGRELNGTKGIRKVKKKKKNEVSRKSDKEG